MSTYFHCAPIPLAPGSIICPGNWGRLVRLYQGTETGTFNTAFRERVLEDIRGQEFPEKPSRLSSCFVLPTLDEAKNFRNKSQRLGIIYEVEPIKVPTRSHTANHLFVPTSPYYFDNMKDIARNYWSGKYQDHPEIVIPVPIRILRCVDDSVPDLPGLRDGTSAGVHGNSGN